MIAMKKKKNNKEKKKYKTSPATSFRHWARLYAKSERIEQSEKW